MMGGVGARRGSTAAFICAAVLVLNVAAGVQQVSATTFSVRNLAPDTPGGQRYTRALGDAWTLQMLQEVSAFIVGRLSPSYRPVDHLTFEVKDDPSIAAGNSNNVIQVGAQWLARVPARDGNDLRYQIKGLMFHEVCHSFQNNRGDYGGDAHFRGIIEGIATYMELVAGYGIDPRAKGGRWYDGYHTTAHFLAWIERAQRQGFVRELNRRMGQRAWTDDFFRLITDKDVDTLWALYQRSF